MYIAWITLHVIKVGSNWNSNLPSCSTYISSSIMSIYATTNKKGGGGGPTFMILYIMNQVYSACVIQCTIQIFHHFYKSEILNLKWQHFSYQTHTLYLSHLDNDNTILCMVNIYSTSTLSVGKTGYSCKDSVYLFYASIRIWHCIFSVSFRFQFRSVFPFRVLVTPCGVWLAMRANQMHL